MKKDRKFIKKLVELEDEIQLKKKLLSMEQKCLKDELNLIKKATGIKDDETAYNLLLKYRGVWEFAGNVSTSGDSLIVTLPKKEATKRGFKKGAPVLTAVKKLRFF